MPTLKFDPKDPVIIIDTKIKGSVATIARLVLDTGASYVVLPWKLTQSLQIEIDSAKTVQTTTASTVETVPEIVVPEMSILGNTVKNVKAIVKDLPSESHVDGLLGLSFLKHFKLEVDFLNGVLKLNR